jgi:hypothetical protein
MSRGPDRRLTTDDVYELLDNRSRPKRPLVTTGWIMDELGYSRPTVNDRLDDLEAEGRIVKHEFKNTRGWTLQKDEMVSPDDGRGMCPECHGILTRDPEYDPGFTCLNCSTTLAQVYDGEEVTKYGRNVIHATNILSWWMSLPERARGFVIGVASVFMGADTPPKADYRRDDPTVDDIISFGPDPADGNDDTTSATAGE